nr:hypothetical protein Itr_chr13CG00180 [Ipomoea trifida]
MHHAQCKMCCMDQIWAGIGIHKRKWPGKDWISTIKLMWNYIKSRHCHMGFIQHQISNPVAQMCAHYFTSYININDNTMCLMLNLQGICVC